MSFGINLIMSLIFIHNIRSTVDMTEDVKMRDMYEKRWDSDRPLSDAGGILLKRGWKILTNNEFDDKKLENLKDISMSLDQISPSGRNLLITNFGSLTKFYSRSEDVTDGEPVAKRTRLETGSESISKTQLIGLLLSVNYYESELREEDIFMIDKLNHLEIFEILLSVNSCISKEKSRVFRMFFETMDPVKLSGMWMFCKMDVLKGLLLSYNNTWKEDGKKLTILNLDNKYGLTICEYLYLFDVRVLDIKFADWNGMGARKLSDAISKGWLKDLEELHIPGIPATSLFNHMYGCTDQGMCIQFESS